jgi:hypothetical protein
MVAVAACAGALLDGAGLLALRAATRAKGARRAVLIAAGWGALLLSVWPWMHFGGGDRGLAIGVCVTMAFAGAVVACSLVVRRARAKTAADNLDPAARAARPWRALVRVIAAGPLAGAAAFVLGALIALHGGGALSTRSITAAYLTPLLWGGAMAWAMADERLYRASLGLTAIAALGAGALAWLSA